MGNDSRNDYELPCYMDVGSKLFPEAPPGQNLDLTDPNTRDQMLKKHIIRENQRKGMQPIQFWALSHRDITQGNHTHGSGGSSDRQDGDELVARMESGYPQHGGEHQNDRAAQRPRSMPTDPGSNNANFYHEQIEKIFSGPFTIHGEHLPQPSTTLLQDFGAERPANDVVYFLRDDAMRVLGRLPQVGDLWLRFDGLVMEILTSDPHQAENWEWLYQACNSYNTNKTPTMFFRRE